MDGIGDHGIGETRDDLCRHGLPRGAIQPDEETPIGEPAGEGELVDRGVRGMKARELLRVVLDDGGNHASEAAERLIPVAGDRPPGSPFALETDPAPLIEVAIPIAHQDVDQPGTQVIARIDFLAVAFVEQDEEVERVSHLPASGSFVLDPLLEQSEHPGEDGAELAETRVVRHHGEPRRSMENAHRLEQRCHHQRRSRMHGAGQVLDDVTERGLPRLGIEHPGWVLVDGAEAPGVSVSTLQAETRGLLAATAPLRPQSPIEGLQVEEGRLDRRRPEIAPLRAEEEPRQPTRLIMRSGCLRLDARRFAGRLVRVGRRPFTRSGCRGTE